MEALAHRPPPDPPEFPESSARAPLWPAWYAGVGFLVGLIVTFFAVAVIAVATGSSGNEESPTFTIFATLVQSAAFVGAALLFASLTQPPRPWQFGLRPCRVWSGV